MEWNDLNALCWVFDNLCSISFNFIHWPRSDLQFTVLILSFFLSRKVCSIGAIFLMQFIFSKPSQILLRLSFLIFFLFSFCVFCFCCLTLVNLRILCFCILFLFLQQHNRFIFVRFTYWLVLNATKNPDVVHLKFARPLPSYINTEPLCISFVCFLLRIYWRLRSGPYLDTKSQTHSPNERVKKIRWNRERKNIYYMKVEKKFG